MAGSLPETFLSYKNLWWNLDSFFSIMARLMAQFLWLLSFFGVLLSSPFLHAGSCLALAAEKDTFLSLRSQPLENQKLYYRLQKPSNAIKGSVLLVHALAVDSSTLKGLADNYLRDGYEVLRVDLLGHGKTLEATSSDQAPDVRFESQSIALQELIETLDLHNLRVIGHSYGGAVSLKLAERMNSSGRIQSVTVISPYLQRIDQFYRHQWVDWASQLNPSFGFFTGWFDAQYPNWYDNNYTQRATDTYLRQHYTGLIGRIFPGTSHLRERVEGAIATVKDIQGVDLIANPPNIGSIPLNIFYCGEDELLPENMVESFFKTMVSKGYTVSFKTLPGAGHLAPIEQPEKVYP